MDETVGYKKLVAWQKADALVREIYKVTKDFPREELHAMTGQIRRAALSVPLNIVEGYARQSRKTFANFLSIAYGSLMEVEYLVGIARDLGYIPAKDAERLLVLVHENGRLLWQLRRRFQSG